jgi:gamma-glutamyltranspeptidase/glutathione hydrolase
VVATVNPLASEAAVAAFDRGGNAIDAAVAASLMLSVVDGHNSGLGGGCLALIRDSQGSITAVDGREMAPERARPQMFYLDGKPAPQLSQLGPLAAGVPGLVAALSLLSQTYGRLSWTVALEQAARVAENGFTVSPELGRALQAHSQQLQLFPSSAKVLLDPTGNPWQPGSLLRQVDLAKTLRALASDGAEWFYRGEFARATEDYLKPLGGLIAASDFAQYQALERSPVKTPYRDYSVIGFPPPSSGGIHIAQMLGMLSDYDVATIFQQSEATGLHLLLEVMKRAMADRAYWLGDTDFAKVPRGLLELDYLRERAANIDLERATAVSSHGTPPRADVDLFGNSRHTTHLTTADAEGNVVALTQTINTSFGNKMMVPGTGVILNNELDDFSIAPGVRNAFGLLGSEANLIAPRKRPLSSMSPTIVMNAAGDPLLTIGAAGGPKIITAVLQTLIRVLDLDQDVDQALAAPRVHHQWSPDTAVCERRLDESIIAELARRGHRIERIANSAVAQGIRIDASELLAASDPRVSSSAKAQ